MPTKQYIPSSSEMTELSAIRDGKRIEKRIRMAENIKEDPFSNIRFVFGLSKAVREEFQSESPEIIAAIMLALTDKKREDLVQRPEGIYLSKECWERIASYQVWLSEDGMIFVTRSKFTDESDEADKDSREFLNKNLPTAKNIGEMPSIAYAVALAKVLGLDAGKILIRNDPPSVKVDGMAFCDLKNTRSTIKRNLKD